MLELYSKRANDRLRVNVGGKWSYFSEKYIISARMYIAYIKNTEY